MEHWSCRSFMMKNNAILLAAYTQGRERFKSTVFPNLSDEGEGGF